MGLQSKKGFPVGRIPRSGAAITIKDTSVKSKVIQNLICLIPFRRKKLNNKNHETVIYNFR